MTNVPKAIEQAFAVIARKHGELGVGTRIRCWQSLKEDTKWNKDIDREFPLLDVRCTPPESDTVERTLIAECSLLCGTMVDDDKDHAQVSQLYSAVQDIADRLFSGAGGSSDNAAIYAEFIAEVAARLLEQSLESTVTVSIGGLTFGTPLAPYDDNGANMIGLAVRVHYSRSDF